MKFWALALLCSGVAARRAPFDEASLVNYFNLAWPGSFARGTTSVRKSLDKDGRVVSETLVLHAENDGKPSFIVSSSSDGSSYYSAAPEQVSGTDDLASSAFDSGAALVDMETAKSMEAAASSRVATLTYAVLTNNISSVRTLLESSKTKWWDWSADPRNTIDAVVLAVSAKECDLDVVETLLYAWTRGDYTGKFAWSRSEDGVYSSEALDTDEMLIIATWVEPLVQNACAHQVGA
jgi:hypothetical protein